MENKVKKCYIIAGPNGAGKTTFALRYLSTFTNCKNFINADMIAAGISPLQPQKVQIQASKLFLNEIKRHIEMQETFAFETTLSGKSYVKLVNELKYDNWEVILIYLWIPSIEFSELRVKERVLQGGHNIPIDAINRRYAKSIKNLFSLFMPICDIVHCFDNSQEALKPIFYKKETVKIFNNNTYNIMRSYTNES